MTPTQQALALDALRKALPVVQAYANANPCFTNGIGTTQDPGGAHALIGTIGAAIASLEAAPAAPEFADKTITAREVARQVFALCEWFEDLPDGAQDSQEEARFKAGQRFSAKRIRNGIGTWLTDEENARKQLAVAAPAAVAEPADRGEVVVTKDEAGQIVAVTRQDEEGRVLSVIAESTPPAEPSAEVVLPDACGVVGLSAERFVGGYVGTETIPFTHAPPRPEAMLFKELALGTLLVTRDECRAYGDARAAAAILADRAARGVRVPLTIYEANALAKKHAMLTKERYPYLPRTPKETIDFVPHWWVVEAIIEASRGITPTAPTQTGATGAPKAGEKR